MACTWLCAAGGQQQQGTVIVTVPTVTLGGVVGNVPFQTTCSNCNQSVITAVSYETGGLTWLIFAILCFVGSVPTCPDGQISNIQGDHFSGKPGNVREFDSCQGNVRDFTKSQGNVREKILSAKSCRKLFIVSCIFVSIQVF